MWDDDLLGDDAWDDQSDIARVNDLARRGAVTADRNAANSVEDDHEAPLALRSFIAGLVVADMDGVDATYAAETVRRMEPEIARLEMEIAYETGTAFDDLPIYDPGNGS